MRLKVFNRVVKTEKGYYKYSWSEVFLVLAVFTKELGSRNDYGIDFDYLGYPFFIIYFFIYFGKIISYNAAPAKLFVYLTFSSLFSIFFLNLTFDGFLKQIIPIVIILSVSFTILKYKNITQVFELYVKVTFWTAVFGIVQVIFSLFGIFLLTNAVGRLDSIAYEPSHYAALLIPGLVYSYINRQRYKIYLIVMLVALLLTFNLTAYLVFLGIFTVATFNPIYVLVTVPIAYYLFFNVLPTFSTNFGVRFNDTFSTISGQKSVVNANLEVNGTTLSFFSNYEVAKYTLSKNFLTGSGLGGHEQMYTRRFDGTVFRTNYYYGLNAKSAHSLGIRILSELGLLGALLYIYTLVNNIVLSKKGMYYAISLACISHFLCKFLKLGGYIDYGTPFFFTVLLLNAKAYRNSKNTQAPRVERYHTFPVHQTS